MDASGNNEDAHSPESSAPDRPETPQAGAHTDEFLHQFGMRLAAALVPSMPLPTVQTAILKTINEMRGWDASSAQAGLTAPATQPPRKMELVFVHDCRNHGCNVPHCVLCKHNPNKRCTGNFAHKYWVGDKLLAKCEGEIQVELIDAISGERVPDDLTTLRVEACILDGNKYNARCREAGEQRLDILDECEVLRNQKLDPLLTSANCNNTSDEPRVVLKFQNGVATVPLKDMKVTESSESVLAGTKRPPFRLVVRAVSTNGRRLHVRPAVSEEFVVVTKRTKNLKKQEIPSLDDPIAKLNHIGKETVKKLNELKFSADEVQLELNLPPELHRITKVREFVQLARLSEADGHLQQKLKQLLKLSKEKWDAACEHGKTAVQVDNRMRAWYMQNMSVGLLYTCTLGDVRPDCPVALIQNRKHEGADFMEVIPMEHQMPAQREQVQGTCEQAIRCWWEDSHPGWMIFTLGNKHFETLDQIIQYSRTDAQMSEEAEPLADARPQSEGVASSGLARGPPFANVSAGSAESNRSEMPNGSSVRGPGHSQGYQGLLPASSLSLNGGLGRALSRDGHLALESLSSLQSPYASTFQGFPQHPPLDMSQPTHTGGFVAQTGKAEEGDQEDFNPFQAATVLPFGGFARHDSAAGALPGDGRAGLAQYSGDAAVNALAAAFEANGSEFSQKLGSMSRLSLSALMQMGSLPSLGIDANTSGSFLKGLPSFPSLDEPPSLRLQPGDSGRGEKRKAPEEDLKAGTAPAGDIMAANGSTLAGNGNSGAHSPPEPPAKRLAVTAGGEAS